MSNYFYDGIIPNYVSGSKSIKVDPTPASSTITLTDGTTTNTLTQSDWTGNIRTVNTTANLTHYLNFSDQAASGLGHPQKVASLSCNPSTGLLTATTFSGALSGNATSATSIALTSDNTSGNYYLPFSKTGASPSPLFIDDTTTALTYNPFTHVITATTFAGNASSASAVALTSDNTNGSYFIPFSKTVNSTSPLFVDNATIPLTYNPSSNTLTCSNFNGIASTASTSASITLTSDNTSGTYFIPFSKTVGASSALFVDNTTTALTYDPDTSTLTATSFNGDLTGNATTSSSSSLVALTSDNTAGSYYIPFSKNVTSTSTLFVDDVTTSFRYNPNTATLFASTFSGSLSGNASTASTSASITLTGDNTSGAYFIPFCKTVGTSSALFVDNGTTPLSYDPSTSRLACNEFSGDLLGTASLAALASTATTVSTTNDNANISYNLVFCAGALPTSNLLVDQLTGPLTYNPSTGAISTTSVIASGGINALAFTGEMLYSGGVSPAATFAGTTLTVNLNSVSIRMNTIIFTGAANTVTTLSVTGPRNNGMYYVGIRNNGSAGTSFLTGLGANILTKYSSTVVVPASSSALMSINIITINAIQTTVIGIDLLT